MDLSAFQLNKNNARSNANDRLHETPLISYGRIIRVIDIQTVICEATVQTSLSRAVYTVTLLNLSSALLEINAYPKKGDTVLLLFLQRYDPRMFVQETVHNPDAAGYNKFSGVGVLMSTVKGFADTALRLWGEPGGSVAELNSGAKWCNTFNNSMSVMFCRAVYDSEDEQLINLVFGKGRTYLAQHLSRVERQYGFWKGSDGNLEELDAAVTEKYSRYAPITKTIQGSQTYTVGKDDEGNDTDAPVSVELGGNADIDLMSMSGKSTHYQKDVIESIGGDREETVGGSAKYTSADTDIKSTAPIGLNAGLYKTALMPYLNAETAAHTALGQAAQLAAGPLASLDALSGGTGLVTGLGAAIIAFCAALQAADSVAHTALTPVVK